MAKINSDPEQEAKLMWIRIQRQNYSKLDPDLEKKLIRTHRQSNEVNSHTKMAPPNSIRCNLSRAHVLSPPSLGICAKMQGQDLKKGQISHKIKGTVSREFCFN